MVDGGEVSFLSIALPKMNGDELSDTLSTQVLMKTQNSFLPYPDALLSGMSFRPDGKKQEPKKGSKL